MIKHNVYRVRNIKIISNLPEMLPIKGSSIKSLTKRNNYDCVSDYRPVRLLWTFFWSSWKDNK